MIKERSDIEIFCNDFLNRENGEKRKVGFNKLNINKLLYGK